jgi:hypothetical protein
MCYYYYATFLRLRRECHIQNLPEKTPNLEQFQFKVVNYLGGWGYMSLGCSQKLLKSVASLTASTVVLLILICASSIEFFMLLYLLCSRRRIRHVLQFRCIRHRIRHYVALVMHQASNSSRVACCGISGVEFVMFCITGVPSKRAAVIIFATT